MQFRADYTPTYVGGFNIPNINRAEIARNDFGVNMLGQLTLPEMYYPTFLLGQTSIQNDETFFDENSAQYENANWITCLYSGVGCPQSSGNGFLDSLSNRLIYIFKNLAIAGLAIALIVAGIYLLKNDAVKLVK